MPEDNTQNTQTGLSEEETRKAQELAKAQEKIRLDAQAPTDSEEPKAPEGEPKEDTSNVTPKEGLTEEPTSAEPKAIIPNTVEVTTVSAAQYEAFKEDERREEYFKLKANYKELKKDYQEALEQNAALQESQGSSVQSTLKELKPVMDAAEKLLPPSEFAKVAGSVETDEVRRACVAFHQPDDAKEPDGYIKVAFDALKKHRLSVNKPSQGFRVDDTPAGPIRWEDMKKKESK